MKSALNTRPSKSFLPRILSLFAGFFLLGALSACAPAGITPAPEQSPLIETQSAGAPIKVGILLPLSGQNKGLGQSMLNAAQMALFDSGMDNFVLIPRDTQSTPAQAATAAQEAINAGAQIILGPVFAADVRAVTPVARRAGINVIAFSTDWALAGGNTLIMGFLPFDQIERITGFAARNGIKTIGILSPTNEYGSTVARRFSQESARSGMRVVSTIPFPETRPDLQGAVQSLSRSAQPLDAVFMPVGGDQAAQIADIMSAQGMSPAGLQRIGMGLFDDTSLARNPNLDGAWFAAPAPNLRSRFEDRYRVNYGAAPPRISTLAYDATALAAVLAKRATSAGQTSAAFNRDALMNPNGFSGIDGIFRFRPDGTAERGLAVLQFKNGAINMIEGPPRTFQATAP